MNHLYKSSFADRAAAILSPARLVRLLLVAFLFPCSSALADDIFNAGPLYDEFPLTLVNGHKTEALGPLFYQEQQGPEKIWALPPLFSHETNAAVEARENDWLYPLMTYENYGREFRWQFVQLFSVAGGREPDGSTQRRVTIFPLYFHQRSTDPDDNYTALVPFYGHLKDRLFRDRIFFVMFPLYSQTRKHDVVTDNYLYPIFDVQHGTGMHGWQVWPLVGAQHKVVTTITNGWGEKVVVGGYDHFFALWPVHFRQNNGIGTDNPEKFRADLPFYAFSRSPQRDYTAVLWPFFNWIDDRQNKYREWEEPWPLVVVARGPGKTATRVLPLFGRAHNDKFEDDFYLWPLYKFDRYHAGILDRRRTRILFFLFQNTVDINTSTAQKNRRLDLWPLFTWHRDFNGDNRLQVLALIESFLPNNRGIERNWSPLWSVWVSENNPGTGAHSRSLLWNLYRRDSTPDSKKCSFLFGLYQYQSNPEGKTVRLFYLPIVRTKTAK